jgi:TatD DNase family protein
MNYPYINIHTHRRTGEGIEMVSAMAGSDARMAAIAAGMDWVEPVLPSPPLSIGIHPWQVGKTGVEEALLEMEAAPVSAIGEIGLDYAVSGDSELQKRVFAAQLRIAEKRRLPVILHCVRAFEPTMEMLKGYSLPAVIFHGFIGSREQAARAVSAGYYLSYGARSMASPKTLEALKTIPLERLFLETDDAPVSIGDIYTLATQSLAISVARLKELIYKNFADCFGQASQ